MENISLVLFFAFLGGLILNIMPCVLPVLSIKILSVVKYSGETKRNIRLSFFATSLGIITSFILLAITVIYFKKLGVELGWGFQFQQPLFLVAVIFILFLFSINQLGLFEIYLPSGLSNKINNASGGKSFRKNFLLGIFATLMATPCSAPYLGTAISFALTASNYYIILIFLFISFGLATPYILFALSPSLISILPKPGSWMEILKKIMGFLLLLSVIWLLVVLSKQISIENLFAIIAILVTMFLLFLIRFDGEKLFFLRKIFVLALCGIGLAIVHFDPKNSIPKNEVINFNDWIGFDEAKVIELKNTRVILVDVTATWCVTCKFNELHVLNSANIQNYFKQNQIVRFRADFTNPSAVIKDYLNRNKRNGIPFNIVYGPKAPNGIILPELLSEKVLIEALERAR
jgi:suppressor for copper-sensitivity B